MLRRMLAGLLVVTSVAISFPAPVSAGDQATAPAAATLSAAVMNAAVAEAIKAPPRLQQAQGQQQPAQGGSRLGTRAKVGIGAAVAIAAIAAGFAVAKGPEPRRWP